MVKKTISKLSMLVASALIFTLLSSAAFSAIGVTHPTDMELKPGQSDRFKFEIQAVSHNSDVECSYKLDQKTVFDVIFDGQSPVAIPAKNVAVITGTVRVNETIAPGAYKRNIEVSCKDIVSGAESQGSAAIGVYNIFFNVLVVGERTRENIYVNPASEKKFYESTSFMAAFIVLIISIIALAIYLVLRKKRKNPQ